MHGAGREGGGAFKRPGERRESLGGTCLKCSLPRSWGVDRGIRGGFDQTPFSEGPLSE